VLLFKFCQALLGVWAPSALLLALLRHGESGAFLLELQEAYVALGSDDMGIGIARPAQAQLLELENGHVLRDIPVLLFSANTNIVFLSSRLHAAGRTFLASQTDAKRTASTSAGGRLAYTTAERDSFRSASGQTALARAIAQRKR
jgi:hypothetical protein